MDEMEESLLFDGKVEALINMFKATNDILKDDMALLHSIKQHYTEDAIKLALENIIDRKMPELEIELTCDLASINDTVDFFERIMTNTPKEEIFSKVNEVVLVVNSINMTLTQTYNYWKSSYEFYSGKIDEGTFISMISKANQDSMLRYILSDIIKFIQANDVYGERITEIINTDYYGLRYQAENAFIEDIMTYINADEFFKKIYANSYNYKNILVDKLESLKNVLLKW